MRIKKTSETTPIQAQVVNTESNSTQDTYSCDYVNNAFKDAGVIVNDTEPNGNNRRKVWIKKSHNMCNTSQAQTGTASSGIILTLNNDSSLTVTGTAQYLTALKVSQLLSLTGGTTYYISGGKSNNCKLGFRNSSLNAFGTSSTGPNKEGFYTPESNRNDLYLYLTIPQGATLNETIYPMIATISGLPYSKYGKDELCILDNNNNYIPLNL